MMNNISKPFINIGDTKQSNTIVINAEIDASIKRIEKDFLEGKFSDAVEFLEALLLENQSNEKAKYQLLLRKIEFAMHFRKFDNFKELIESIESNYKAHLDTKFKELKLTLMALEKNEEFFSFSKQLRLETPNSKPQGHFDLVYSLNTGVLDKAKEIFEIEIQKDEYRKHLILLGGHIYSNLYKYDEDQEDNYHKADAYYQEALGTLDLSFLDRFIIQGFYATQYINNQLRHKRQSIDITFLQEYKKSLDLIFEHEKYFSDDYISNQLENYIFALLSLDKFDEYTGLYEKYQDKLPIRFYLQSCDVKKTPYRHDVIQSHIKAKFDLNDLLLYTSLVTNSDENNIEIIIDFLNENKDYIQQHNFVIYIYVRGSISIGHEVDRDVLSYIEEHKLQDIDMLLAFLATQKYQGLDLELNDLNQLFEFAAAEDSILPRKLDAMDFFQEIGDRRYIRLAIQWQAIFPDIIYEALKLCAKDRNLTFEDFEFFVERIVDVQELYAVIGNLYFKYDKLDKAFDYFYLEYLKEQKLEIAFALLNASIVLFSRSGEKYEFAKQQEIFRCFLPKIDQLGIENILFLLSYEINVLQDSKQILPILNQKLLEQDINSLDETVKIGLSNAFLQTQFMMPNFQKIFLHDKNMCFEKDGITYVSEEYSILEVNKTNFEFHSCNNDEYYLIQQDESYNQTSLFHRIVGPFAFRCDNPSLIKFEMDMSADDPLTGLFEFLNEQGEHTKDLFQRYSNGAEIGLFGLAQHQYHNYFSLIPFLLEHQEINFNAGKINYKPDGINKILTLSSIVFLNHIGYLDRVLHRSDVYIQRTTINWLKDYTATIGYTNMPTEFDYIDELDNQPTLRITAPEDMQKFKDELSGLTHKVLKSCQGRIIEDQLSIIPIRGAYEMLSKHIGNQEYQALAYCAKYNFQIITEDSIFSMLFRVMKYDDSFISNSLCLLNDVVDFEELRDLKIYLFQNKYKYVLHELYVNVVIKHLETINIRLLDPKEWEQLKIAYSYGWFDQAERYLYNKFSGVYIKPSIPAPSRLDENLFLLFEYVQK